MLRMMGVGIGLVELRSNHCMIVLKLDPATVKLSLHHGHLG